MQVPAAPPTLRVLVIDDSPTIRRSAEMVLARAGLQVDLAENGFAALARISDCRPDLILLDVMMPRLDGYQTCSLLRRNPAFADVPVIMLSGKDTVFDRVRGRLAGSDLYLTKPFTSETLLEAVHAHLPARGCLQGEAQ
ncbi:MAG: response regulator [Pseudomonadota bacterium]|nr:response regulator [Pseudomonadota bacterium]